MNEQAKAIFSGNILGAIATVNEDGSPWVSPLHMVTDGDYVYWFSAETAAHSQNIARDARISLSLFSTDTGNGLKGVYINGEAQKLAGDDDATARAVAADRLGIVPKSFEAFSAYRISVGTLDEQKSAGNCWYFYS